MNRLMRVTMMIHPMIHPITTWTLLVSIKLAIQLTNMPPPPIHQSPSRLCAIIFWFPCIYSSNLRIQILLLPLEQEDGDLEETICPD